MLDCLSPFLSQTPFLLLALDLALAHPGEFALITADFPGQPALHIIFIGTGFLELLVELVELIILLSGLEEHGPSVLLLDLDRFLEPLYFVIEFLKVHTGGHVVQVGLEVGHLLVQPRVLHLDLLNLRVLHRLLQPRVLDLQLLEPVLVLVQDASVLFPQVLLVGVAGHLVAAALEHEGLLVVGPGLRLREVGEVGGLVGLLVVLVLLEHGETGLGLQEDVLHLLQLLLQPQVFPIDLLVVVDGLPRNYAFVGPRNLIVSPPQTRFYGLLPLRRSLAVGPSGIAEHLLRFLSLH